MFIYTLIYQLQKQCTTITASVQQEVMIDLVQMVFFIMILPLVNPVSLIEVILYFTISDCVLKRVFSFPCEVTGAHYIYKVILRSPVHADIWDYSQRP